MLGSFGMPKTQLAVLPAPIRNDVASGLTRPQQPGAPYSVTSSGSGPNGDAVLLNPVIMIAIDCGRLLRLTVSVVPRRGRLADRLVMPSELAQPAPKKP